MRSAHRGASPRPTPRPRWAPLALAVAAAALALGCSDGPDAGLPTDPDFGAAAVRTVTITPGPGPVAFGTLMAPFGSTNAVAKTFTITNGAAKVTTALTVQPLSAPFAITGDNCTGRSLATSGKNKSCTVTVTFTPTAIGTATATLTVLVAQPKTTLKVDLSGSGQGLSSISGTVFTDPDVSGTKGETETGRSGVEVRLWDALGVFVLASVTTDADGGYLFPAVKTRAYRLEVVPPEGTAVTTPNAQPAAIQLSLDGYVLNVGVNRYNIIGRVVNLPDDATCGPENLDVLQGALIRLYLFEGTRGRNSRQRGRRATVPGGC